MQESSQSGGGRERMKLDEMMQLLFRLSEPVTLHLINGLFQEQFTAEEVLEIQYEDSRFRLDDWRTLEGDLFISLRTKRGIFRYHIEFQTLKDRTMVIRMFRYGVEKAMRGMEGSGSEEIVVALPEQRVIYLEENKNIGDTLSLVFKAGGQELRYSVPVIKYWTYSAEELRRLKLYALIPLQVFNIRIKLKRIERSRRSPTIKRQQITEQFLRLREIIHRTVHMLEQLYHEKELAFGDLEQMLEIVTYIAEHLYDKYDPYMALREEVGTMLKTLFDPKIWEEGEKAGVKKVAQQMLTLDMEIELIEKATGLSADEIKQLRTVE